MKELSAPKAINIIRPSKQNTIKNNHPQFISKPSKITQSQIHGKTSTFSLYDPKQSIQQPAFHVQPLKKPVIELYRPEKHQLKIVNRSQISQKPEVTSSIFTNRHLAMDKLKINEKEAEDLSALSDQDQAESDDDDYDSDDEEQDEEEEGEEEEEEEEEGKEVIKELDKTTGDSLPEARINRKIADLEISNKSLLTINEMLEITVRHQAKQVASFKKQMMTCPDFEKQEQQQREEIIQRAEDEDDWENDEQFNRLKRMTEMMLEQAQNALLFQAQAIGGRVIMTGQHHRRPNGSRRRINTRSNNDTQQQQQH